MDGLNSGRSPARITYFDSTASAAVAEKTHHPRIENQSPFSVPGTRSNSATPLPVNSALAGQAITLVRRAVNMTSSSPAVPIATRICAIDRSNPMLT